MKNRLITHSDLDRLFSEHINREEAIWAKTKEDLYQMYLKKGYWPMFAEEKAEKDVWELRSQPKNIHPIHIPQEFTTQGDLD